MVQLAIIVFISTMVFAVVVEVHCRLQTKMVVKPRSIKNLVKHYFIALPLILLMLFYVIEIRNITLTLGLSELKSTLLDLVCLIIFITPLMYIMDRRYPGLINKMENWRKNT
jgi:hypothetical protein